MSHSQNVCVFMLIKLRINYDPVMYRLRHRLVQLIELSKRDNESYYEIGPDYKNY